MDLTDEAGVVSVPLAASERGSDSVKTGLWEESSEILTRKCLGSEKIPAGSWCFMAVA